MDSKETKEIDSMIFTHLSGGGCCSGKSTSDAKLADYAQNLGFDILFCPEAATIVFKAGVLKTDPCLQEYILDLQIQNEKFLKQVARKTVERNRRPLIISHDRGLLDGLAYVSDQSIFLKLLASRGLSKDEILLNGHYTVATHLVTAAIGVPEFFSNNNNAFRTETLEEAQILDPKLQEVPKEHPNYEIIGNLMPDNSKKPFDIKMNELSHAVFSRLQYPAAVQKQRRWILNKKDFSLELFAEKKIPINKSDVTQTYILPKGDTDWDDERVRLRVSQNGYPFYFYTKKKRTEDPQERFRTEVLIDERKYRKLLINRDFDRAQVKKELNAFIWKDQVFTLAVYENPKVNYVKLELEGSRIETFIAPDFLPDLQEVTNDPQYKEHNMSLLLK
jgi:hypothetical protein